MPVKRTRAKRRRRLDDYKRQQLLEGPDSVLLAAVGYLAPTRTLRFSETPPDEQAAILADMERDWLTHGPELMAWWKQGADADLSGHKPWTFVIPGGPETLPWAATQFSTGETRRTAGRKS